MAPLRPVLKQRESGRQSAPFTVRPKVKSRTLKVPFSAALAGNFPCLWGAEPISSGSQPRDTGQTSSPTDAPDRLHSDSDHQSVHVSADPVLDPVLVDSLQRRQHPQPIPFL